MKQRSYTSKAIRILAMLTTTAIVVAANTGTISTGSILPKYLTTNRFLFSTKLRSSYDKMILKHHGILRNCATIEKQRMAFVGLAPRQPNIRTLPRLINTDHISMMIPSIKNQFQIPVPVALVKSAGKQSAAPTGTRLYHSSPQRNFFKKNNNQNDDETGIVGQAKKLAKKFLPSTWFQSDEERRQIAEQKQMQKDIQTGIQQIFKDAPLPIRMVSNLISPIFGSMMSSLAETAASQQSLIDVVYDQAVQAIRTDPLVEGLLGNPITVGRPFSQSSSSSSINGVTSTRIELAFPVAGRLGNGIGRLSASGGAKNPIIDRLVVQANGREVDVSIGASSLFNQRTSNAFVKDKSNIIDAEIIEKDTKK